LLKLSTINAKEVTSNQIGIDSEKLLSLILFAGLLLGTYIFSKDLFDNKHYM